MGARSARAPKILSTNVTALCALIGMVPKSAMGAVEPRSLKDEAYYALVDLRGCFGGHGTGDSRLWWGWSGRW